MNKERRKQINDLYERLREINSELGTVREEEQEAYDNMPESIQESNQGDMAQETIAALEEAESEIESAMDCMSSAAE
jgi:hypothetical protein